MAIIVLWLATTSMAARANGGATQVFRARQGPYEITVGIIPPTPQVGILHFAVSLVEQSTLRPITGATVTIAAQGPQGLAAGPIAATNTYGATNYYDANISLDAPGEWQFQLAVDSPMGKELVAFPLQVRQVTVNWGAIASILVTIVLALPLVVVGYQSLRGRRQARHSNKGKKT